MAVAVLLVLTKSNISGNSKLAVAVFLVLTKSNISCNINVDVADLLYLPNQTCVVTVRWLLQYY